MGVGLRVHVHVLQTMIYIGLIRLHKDLTVCVRAHFSLRSRLCIERKRVRLLEEESDTLDRQREQREVG